MKNKSGVYTKYQTKADYVDSDVGSSHEYIKDNCLYVYGKWKYIHMHTYTKKKGK